MISFLFRHSQQSNITKILCHSLVCSVINPRFALIGRKQNSAHSMLYAPSTRLARCVYCLSKIDFDGIRLSKFNVTRCSFCALSWKRKGGGGGGIEQYMILMFNHICGCSCSYFSFQFFSLIFSQPLIFPCVMQLFVIHEFFSAPKFFRSPLPSLALKSNVSFKHICDRSFLCLISCVSCSRSVYFFICPLNTRPMPLIVEGMETSF